MKKQIKYCVLGLFFCLLLNIVATRVAPSVPILEEKSDISYLISQNDATQNSIRLFYYICSNPLRKAVTVDTQSYYLKNSAILLANSDLKNQIQASFLSEKAIHPYLHSDGIMYYVYTLEKIVI